MHYKGHLVTKKLPTDDEISKILEKYREDLDKEQEFAWDWFQIGGRYGGKIKINFNPDDNEDNWCCFRDRNNKYFISQAINELKEKIKPYYDELEWLKYMGLREKVLYVDGAFYKDMINFDLSDCFVVIDDEENLYVRQQWKNHEWIENKQFDDKVSKIDLKDKFITIIDFHD